MHCWVVDVRRVVAHSNSKDHVPLPGMVRPAVLCSGKQATSAVSLSGCTWTNSRPGTPWRGVVDVGGARPRDDLVSMSKAESSCHASQASMDSTSAADARRKQRC